MWDLIVSVPDHCLSFYSVLNRPLYKDRCLDSSLKDIIKRY